MKLKFLGAAGTVTGSSYILTSGSGRSILIDFGMFQGLPEVDDLNYKPYDYDCSHLSGAILTHAHLDHCGRLPLLLALGYEGPIYMTPPTRDLAELSLLDSARLAEHSRDRSLYNSDQAIATIERFKTVEYRHQFEVSDFKVTFRDAGHILGSAFLEIIDTQADSDIHKIVFSGDLGNTPEDLQKDTERIDHADAVVIESTYGDRLHPQSKAVNALQEEINAIEASGSTLLVPAFSLEKTQEILHMIKHLKREGKVRDETMVYIDSPMGEKATHIYMRYNQYFNDHVRREFGNDSPFDFPGFESVLRRSESQDLDHQSGPKVIIAGSGMMTGGRILGHAAHYLSDATTRLFMVGYQGEGTLGRKLDEGDREVVIEGEKVEVKAHVNNTHGMSSHADQNQLLDWLRPIQNVKKVFITHGEDEPRRAFAQKIKEELGTSDIFIPVLNQEIVF